MKQFLITTIYMLLLSVGAKSQHKNLNLEDLSFIEEKVKKNYPVYVEKQNSKYQQLLLHSKKNISRYSDSIYNFQLLATPVMFFKDLHLRLLTTRPILFDSMFCKKKLQEVKNATAKAKRNEGYWVSDYNDLVIYLKEYKKGNNSWYEAVVVESADAFTKPGSIKFYLTKNKIGKFNITNLITAKGIMVGVYSYFTSKDTLTTGLQSQWIKIKDYQPGYLKKVKQIDNNVAFKVLNANYISIKIPKSDFETKRIVDSLVALNKNLIEKTPNLIIDIRNNTGGTWLVYESLFPYIYTNPIIEGDGYLNCTQDFIDKQKEFIEDFKKDSSLKQYVPENERVLDSMLKYKGGFYYTKGSTVFQYDSIKSNPKKIIVLTNYRCVSSSEMFIKFCQQSKKAIIAGEKTWGASDNVEIVPFITPSGKYKLYIPRVKIVYGKNPPLDFVGISPTINIPATEPDWNKFIVDYFKNKK